MKYFLIIATTLAFIFILGWLFNHVTAWGSIFLGLVAVGGVVYYLENKIKSKNK